MRAVHHTPIAKRPLRLVLVLVPLTLVALNCGDGPGPGGNRAAIALSRNSVAFDATEGGSSPAAQTVEVTNSETGTLSGLAVTIAYGTGQPTGWLTATLNQTTAPATLTLQAATGTLPAGNYSAVVSVTAPVSGNSPQTVNVTFAVGAGPAMIAVNPSGVTFEATAGGANPAPQTAAVTNSGNGTLTGLTATVSYAAGQPTGWLTAAWNQTTAPATLTLQATTGTLAAGTYNATVAVASPVAPNSPQNVSVTFTVTAPLFADLVVTAPATLTVTPTSVGAGGKVTLSDFTVTNQGTAASNLSRVGYYLSVDETITATDVLLATAVFNSLAGGASVTFTGPTLTIPCGTTPGNWFVGPLVDDENATLESSEANNFKSASFATTTGAGSWQSTSIVNAPSARDFHTAVWTGTEMIIWGGHAFDGASLYLNTGARYNPQTDTWQAVSTIGAPAGRSGHTAVWTGTEMIVWGGYNGSSYLNTGGRYNPQTDSWQSLSTTGGPTPRTGPTAVWTGTEMIVWGGYDGFNFVWLNTGGRYDPSSDTWSPTSTGANVPSARSNHTAVWTGAEMVVWGGQPLTNTGGRYNSSTDSWTATSLIGAPSPRNSHTTVLTSTEMIIWGGNDVSAFLQTGGRYNLSAGSWGATSTSNAPIGRTEHRAVWTGTQMIVWGGTPDSFRLGLCTGGRYDPSSDTWSATSTGTNVPLGRVEHTAIWTGTEMVVWGGHDGSTFFQTGGRYTP